MLTIIPQFAIGPTDLMAVFILMSSLGLLMLILGCSFYVVSVNAAGTSNTVDTALAVLAFVVSKLWRTSLLEMVALYNGIGGGAAIAIAALELLDNKADGITRLVVALIGALVGAASLSGSLIAWAKLNGVITRPLRVRGQQVVSLVVVVTGLAVGGYIVFTAQGTADQLIATPGLICLPVGCALVFGALMTLPIGTAQMPVMISSYNACAGLAIGLDGFVLQSPTLMIGGMAVGTARMFLTVAMGKR